MERRFVKASFCWRREIRRSLEVFVLLLCVGWQMVAWVNSLCACMCVCACLFIWMVVCLCMRWCAQIYGTTSNVKLRKIFFLLNKPQCPSKSGCRESSHYSSHSFSFSLLSLLFAFMKFWYCFPPPRGVNDRKFIVQTRCDDNGSVSGAGLGNCA